jgi:hypothetical protein
VTTSQPAPDNHSNLPAVARPRGFFEWFWRGKSLRQVRGYRTTLPTVEQRRLNHAERALELADRALDPVDPLRSGSSVALSISLYREAAYWALLAQSEEYHGATLAEVFQVVPPALLESAAGSPERLTDVKLALVDRSFVETADLAADLAAADAGLARDFVHALIRFKLEPATRVGRLLLQRAVRCIGFLLVLAGVVTGVVLGVERATRKPDLVPGKPWRASSSLETCKPAEHYCASAHTDIFFHTLEEQEPWVEFDLGSPVSFSVVEVTNRSDCCPDRAIPLVVEVSNDQNTWREVARRKEAFSDWRAKFSPQKARYVRLRALRRTLLHLEKVSVRAS